MKAYLILEDGNVFEGESVGADKEVVSEFVFNTSMTGYVEVLTDPSYAGQSVVMTYPLIGNYGVCLEDQESTKPYVEGFVVNELARLGSNFRKNVDLKDYLIEHDIPCIQGIDTRHLTKIIRNKGCMNGMITTTKYDDLSEVMEKIHNFKVTGVVERTTCDKPYTVGSGDRKVALLDFGAKKNIAKSLAKRNIEVTVYPASTPASTIIEGNYDGVMLSNGPVKDLNTGRVYISTQNHNYVICDDSIDRNIAKPWFINVNDQTIEGVEYIGKNIKTVQFHPEACAGPLDTDALFDEFEKMMEGK